MRFIFAGIANFATVLFILCALFWKKGEADGPESKGSTGQGREGTQAADGCSRSVAGGSNGALGGSRGTESSAGADPYGGRWTGRRTLRWIAIVLLVGVFIRHWTAWWLAQGTYLSPQAMFYILGGAWETVLCLVVLGALCMVEPSVWRYIAAAAMTVGALEGFQIAACRAVITDITVVPKSVNLCDYLIGLPLGFAMAALYLIAIAYGVGKYLRTVRAGSS